MTPSVRYPSGTITPHGAYYLLAGKHPLVTLRSYNDAVVLHMLGGPALADPTAPESVIVKDIKGLIPPWQTVDQKGATQDGVTFVDALYDPIEIDMTVVARGRDAAHLRKVIRDLIESIDVKQQAELSFFTHDLGRWWAPVRWFKTPADQMTIGGQRRRQQLTLTLRGDNGFWRSYNNTDSFSFAYEDMTDTFNYGDDESEDLGDNWPQHYTLDGAGYCHANGSMAEWVDYDTSVLFTGTKEVVCGPYKNYSTNSDTQRVAMTFGNTPEFTVGRGAANDLWARMSRDGSGNWAGDGIRARFGWGYVRLSRFNNFVETVLETKPIIIPPLINQRYILEAGYNGDPRRYKLIRDSLFNTVLLDHTESGTGSHVGAAYRGVGFGMQAGSAILTQASPAELTSFDADGDLTEPFNFTDADDLGTNWPLRYTPGGHGDGYVHANGARAVWVENLDEFTDSRGVVNGPYKDFHTDTDNQVVDIVLGSFQEWSFPATSYNDIYGRMGREVDGSWDGNAIRLRIGNNKLRVSAILDFEEAWHREQEMIIPPLPGEKYTLICGYEGELRTFKVMRNSSVVMTIKESGTDSMLGSAYRGIGFGMQAGGAFITQATPARVRKIAAGDNSTVSQSGFLKRINVGDQPMHDRYTLYGPGTFKISNGPNTDDMVEIGPLLTNQIVQIRTDPNGLRGIVDLTVNPPTPQELNAFQEALKDFISFASGNNVPPLLQAIESQFGIRPPQGNLYSLMKGRFSKPIPAKEPGIRAQPYYVKVTIDDGNADSKIVATGTPLRRYPQ